MNARALAMVSAACYGGGCVFALGAIAQFMGHPVGLGPGWLMLIAGGLLALVGYFATGALREATDRQASALSQAELLRVEMDQHRAAVDYLADGLDVAVFICDPKASVVYANRRASEMFRFEEPVGRPVLAVTLSHDIERLVMDAARARAERAAELSFSYPEERTGLVKAWPQPDGGRVFLTIFEITDLRRLERVRQDFVSNVSHELRTPLTIIRVLAETLQDEGQASDEQRRDLGKIITEVDRLSLIASDLLVLSAAESNPPKMQRCDLAELVRAAAEELKGKASEKGLALTFMGPDKLMLAANSHQMTQVARNLIENGLNYTSEGSVQVRLRKEGGEAVLEVQDSGIGIGSEHLPRIFERFYRVDKGRSRSTGGTGLGLSIVKHIVEAHGGTVQVESALNQGSTFTVRLPIVAGDAQSAEA